MPSGRRHAAVPPLAVAAGPTPADRTLLRPGRESEQESLLSEYPRSRLTSANTNRTVSQSSYGHKVESNPVINISSTSTKKNTHATPATDATENLAEELDYITVPSQTEDPSSPPSPISYRTDKASRILGIKHRKSMEPIPASARNSIVSTRSVRDIPSIPSFTPTLPLTSLYVVSGLPKSPHTWTLADPDSVLGLHHAEGAVNRWWRPEVLGSTVSPGAGGTTSKKKKRGKADDLMKGAGSLSKQEVGKMLSKALKLSFTREVEIIASTLQPASTIHTFTFTLPAPSTPLAPTPSGDLLRASVLTSAEHRNSAATFNYTYTDDPFPRPSTAFLGPPSIFRGNSHAGPTSARAPSSATEQPAGSTVTYHGVCLTVWSHADAERSNAIRRTLEAGRLRKESAQSLVTSRLKNLRADVSSAGDTADPTVQARRHAKKDARGPWGDAETDGETEAEGGAVSESDFEVASTVGHGPGESTLFLPGDTVFWLPYALTLVSRHPVYDLMRDYLTLSWARFSKDVQSHTLQISKILSHPAPRAGELIKLDASSRSDSTDSSLEVIARFPGGLDFGRGLVDTNFTMWPLFKCLNIDHILTICEIALSPTGRILFFSRHPAMLGIAVFTIKYLVELRGWNGICLPAVHSRDAKIYIDDPGPWIMGLATEARYSIRPAPEVCVCDLDINYLSCPSPPIGALSTKQQRERYKQRLLAAFDSHYHPDHSVPSEFKEAFPAGRFRPVCKIQAKRGASSSAVAEQIKPPEWWHSTRIIQAFDSVLQDKFKKPSLLKRIGMFGATKRAPQLSAAEQHVQLSIRKRATAFVDARDDLETKIGRLSRRLNFLMTESDLWRDKFVTFEQYAEKLSAEAGQLRTKINKEQKETRRLSGLVTLTAAEKNKLQNQLRETEMAHKDAVTELEKMRETMEKMEQEREEMIAEVEAQIEKALASMAVGMDESDYSDSRPSSRMSSTSKPSRSRRPSDAAPSTRASRPVAKDISLAETDGENDKTVDVGSEEVPANGEQKKGAQSEPTTPNKKKRFSASEVDLPQDTMNAVDEGISIKSDKIARKVLEIEQKLESALSSDHHRRRKRKPKANGVMSPDTEEESSNTHRSTHSRKSKVGKAHTKTPPKTRTRSGTASSTQTAQSTRTEGTVIHPRSFLSVSPESTEHSIADTPTRSTFDTSVDTKDPIVGHGDGSTAVPSKLSQQGAVLPTDESDNDFQSARSNSPQRSVADP